MAEGLLDSGWLKILDVRGPKAFVGLVVCIGISVAGEKHLYALAKAPAWVIIGANVGALLFSALVMLWLGELLLRPFARWKWSRERTADIFSALEGLSREEWEILLGMLHRNQKSVGAPITEPVINSLQAKGLLVQRSGVGNMLNWIFLMPDDVWKLLQKAKAEGNLPRL